MHSVLSKFLSWMNYKVRLWQVYNERTRTIHFNYIIIWCPLYLHFREWFCAFVWVVYCSFFSIFLNVCQFWGEGAQIEVLCFLKHLIHKFCSSRTLLYYYIYLIDSVLFSWLGFLHISTSNDCPELDFCRQLDCHLLSPMTLWGHYAWLDTGWWF